MKDSSYKQVKLVAGMGDIFNVVFSYEGMPMSVAISVFSLGFYQENRRAILALLRNNQVKTVLDVRLNNVSQLAGFAKRDDLRFFLREVGNIDYGHARCFHRWLDEAIQEWRDIAAAQFQDDFGAPC